MMTSGLSDAQWLTSLGITLVGVVASGFAFGGWAAVKRRLPKRKVKP